MRGFHLSIITPEGAAYENVVEYAVVPGVEGELGILARHTPLIAAVKRGILRLKRGVETNYLVIGEGFLEVTAEETVLLADTAVQAESLEDARKIRRRIELELEGDNTPSAADTHEGLPRPPPDHGD